LVFYAYGWRIKNDSASPFSYFRVYAITISIFVLLYEFLGMITNLTAGWIAKRFGLNKTLFAGIILQILSC
jgi:MFS-type transporter involved in bile tolerance (Atg22 family)